MPRTVFLGLDDQFSALELVAQTGVVAVQLLDLSCRGIRLRPPPFWRERRLIGHADLLAPACDHRGVDALATQERTQRTGLLATLGLGNRRFSLPENRRRLAVGTTSGSASAASGETISPVALRAPSATVSPEEPDDPFKEDFSNEVMSMSYLYSKLPETGVPLLIGTGGLLRSQHCVRAA